jgi:hypothetical protein
MHSNLTQTDIDYIESVKTLRPLAKYGSSVNRNLVEIYSRCTGEQAENKTCCSSERAIFYNHFFDWYESI